MIGVLNFKRFDKGAIKGFFDLRYHGLTIKGCRLMTGKNGLWFSFPQKEADSDDGSVQYFDLMFLTAPEREHVRGLILAELESKGLIERPAGQGRPSKPRRPAQRQEDLSAYHSGPEDIPF